jgi:killing trait domain-containing protein
MAVPSIVNPQVTDAVTQSNVKILGDAPGMAMGMLYQATAQALSNAAHNGTAANQNANTILQATTTQGIALLYGVDTAAEAVGISEILGSNAPAYGG